MNQTKILSFVLCGPKFHGQWLGEVSATKLIADDASFTELFWIRKIIIFTPATTKVNILI